MKNVDRDVEKLDLDVADVRQLIPALGVRYPALNPRLKSGLTVAIDC